MPTEPVAGLYAITDPVLTPGDTLLAACAAALRGGCRLLQYRDKPAGEAERLRRAASLRDLCHEHGARLLVNDDLDLARRCRADGVHLGQSDGDTLTARQQLGADALVGVTCHNSADLARAAERAGASYVAFGRFFPSRTKPGAPPADRAVLATPLTIAKVAIGGITPDNGRPLIRAGASALAVIHALFASDDIEATARRFASLFAEES